MFLDQIFVETYTKYVPTSSSLLYHTIPFHCEEQPTLNKTSPQYNTYNKSHFCDATVILYKGWGQITERSVAFKNTTSKALCLHGNMLLIAQMINCAYSGSQNEV